MATKTRNLIVPGDNGDSPSPSQDYIDRLKEELEKARLCFNEACAEADKTGAEYRDADKWKKLLEAFFIRIKVTLQLGSEVVTRLENTKGQAETVCSNLKCTMQAIQILTMEVKETSEAVESLKQMMKDLLDLIDCLNDPVLDPNASILKCILDLKAAIDTAQAAMLNTITAVLQVLKALDTLLCLICENQVTGADGLVEDLDALKALIRTGSFPVAVKLKSTATTKPSKMRKKGRQVQEQELAGGDCKDPQVALDCEIEPGPCFFNPPETNEVCEVLVETDQQGCSTVDYYQDTCNKYKDACKLVDYKKCLLEKAEEAKSKAQAHMDALSLALEAAKAAKNC